VAVGHHSDGHRLRLLEDDVLRVVYTAAPSGNGLPQDGVEPAIKWHNQSVTITAELQHQSPSSKIQCLKSVGGH
jgi:hypothetical protein